MWRVFSNTNDSNLFLMICMFVCFLFLCKGKITEVQTSFYRNNLTNNGLRLSLCDSFVEGCPMHPNRVNLSLVFAIRLTNRTSSLEPSLIELTRIISPNVESSYRKSICTRLRKFNIHVALLDYAGWVENVVDSTRANWQNRYPYCRFVMPEVDLRET